MTDLSQFATNLVNSITPSSSSIIDTTVQSTSSSFGDSLVKQLAQKLNWTEEQTVFSQNIYTYAFYAIASVSGFVNAQADPTEIPQLVFSASTALIYLDYLVLLTGSLQGFVDEIKTQLDASLAGNFDEQLFTSSITSLVEFAQLDQAAALL